ncbi:MAG: hypothetical protein IPK29_19755 [Betaproteobacteria bacterium]|jgi:hypothetical protein|nr:hypothetical protein [Betaproteobacteria bacterium]
MLTSNLTFFLLILIEGCAGPVVSGQQCNGQNFNVRMPFETLEQCEAARKRLMIPGGIASYVRPVCISVPTNR